jgi:bifunctional non-homologous end joining protein LigD
MAKKNPLTEYNRKRDFKKTKEPAGKVVRKKSKKLTFVVQEHHASHLHWDLRLELNGVLKSWAVPKGPSMDPKDKRLAVQTEDHPMEYRTFQGTIPKGEYGGGEMFIWDSGTWEALEETGDPSDAIEKGHMKFTLHGKKLKGEFVLVRTKWGSSDTKKNWLLIKHKEDAKVRPIKKTAAKKVTAKKKSRLIGKDPWPDFIPPQLPRLVSDPPPEDGRWVHEMKFDGYRMQAHLKNGIGSFYTRNALNWSNAFPHLLHGIEKLPVTNAIFDGEIVAVDEEGKSHFQRLQNSLKSKKDTGLVYYVFDILYLDGRDLRKLPLLERKKILKEVLKKSRENIVLSEHFETSAADFFAVSCEHQLEGIISKQGDAPYSSGRNDLWVKVKCTARQEFVIGGWTNPRGGRTGIGALLLGVYEEGRLRYSGRVGTGFDHATLNELKNTLKPLETKGSPFDVNSPKGKNSDTHWVRPVKVCEVSYGQITSEGILRHPVFVGMREDKPAKDIGMDKAKKIKKPAARGKKLAREISSPDKILFKKEGKTKQDVAEYYQTVGHVMLKYIGDRPLSLVRCPNGSEGTCFFQKHITGKIPESFHTFPVKEGEGEGIYLSINSVEGLLELVQLNAFEIHAWGSNKDDYMSPDQIVMDFDPGPGVPWSEVVAAALELKEMLEDLDLKSFVKLTGGKGLHVHIPILPLYDWDQIKSFSQSLALELVARNPAKYVANMSKKLRTKKIFVDYLRNGYGATAVVPYSLRARPLSAVALPVEWSELKKIKDPQEFTMDKALRKIKTRKKDPWEGMLRLKQRINILKPVANKKAA